MNMLATITPKSDQLNADGLIGTTMTITVTKVSIAMAEQPVSIYFEGDGGKPFKPGKSMRRVLVKAWGADANAYVGRSMTLYRDDAVVFGGLAVGGIRISHMTDINGPLTMALTATRGNKKAFTVKPLVESEPAAVPVTEIPSSINPMDAAQDDAATILSALAKCKAPKDIAAMQGEKALGPWIERLKDFPDIHKQVTDQIEAKRLALLSGPTP